MKQHIIARTSKRARKFPSQAPPRSRSWQRLYERRDDYTIGTVLQGGLFLTAGVDIQRDRIELEVVAWGRGKESWSVDYTVLEGATAGTEVWQKLTSVLGQQYPTNRAPG